ncbi:hypothetical protein KKH27_01970 [bacterium]|nr:hypothetical protein [bacterium]MBU1983141.1 hypothetical protein [bacterium]
MRRFTLCLFAVLFAAVAFASAPVVQQSAAPVPETPTVKDHDTYNDGWIEVFPVPLNGLVADRPGRDLDAIDSTVVLDSMEGTLPPWTTIDLTDIGLFWHINDTLPLGGSGVAWWCADTALAKPPMGGGYNDHWLQFLMADTLDLTSAVAPIRLAFKARWKIEAPGGETPPYDMWDGWNMWASNNGGATWNLIDPIVGPAYTGQNAYSFGEIWGYGAGIQAWGGTAYANAYVPFEFNLDAFAGTGNFLVRWAFASDDGFSAIDDSSYYGLIVDSIRITDGAALSLLLSNDGEWDEFGREQGPLAGNTWVYEDTTYNSPTNSWNGEPGHSLLCGIESYPIVLPVGYNRLSVRYWVWCDLPDSDGDNDNSLEDFYDLWIAREDGIYRRVVYDYGYDNGEPAPGGNSLNDWVYRTVGLTSGGTQTPFIDITADSGHTVTLMFRLRTDGNDDGGVGSGLHIDDVEIMATRAAAIDMALRDLTVPFPTTRGMARSYTYRIVNEGLNNIGNALRHFLYYKRPDGTVQANTQVVLAATLTPGQDTLVTQTWTPDQAGSYLNRVAGNYVGDGDRTNDTVWTPVNVPLNSDSNLAVTVQPVGVYELAYHLRTMQSAFLNPRFIRYTPAADGVPAGTVAAYDITKIKVVWQYDEALADTGATTRIEFWAAGPDSNHPGTRFHQIVTQIDTSETVGAAGRVHWWTMDLTGIAALQNRSGDFWVSVTPMDSIGGPLPLPMGRSVTEAPLYDGHHFVVRRDTNAIAVDDLTLYRVGTTNDVILNWSAPNAGYMFKVYRLANPEQDPQFWTLLTPDWITDTQYTDTGVVGLATTKLFYVVIGHGGPLNPSPGRYLVQTTIVPH